MTNIIIKELFTGTPEYTQMVALRDAVLRIPLGLSIRNDNLSGDAHDILLAAFEDEEITGCVILHRMDEATVRLRAMAVTAARQGKGLGRMLVEAAEQRARAVNYRKIILHARIVAAGFYERMGYGRTGDLFTEVGIPHVLMQKELP